MIRECKGNPAVAIRYYRGGSYDDTAILAVEVLPEVIRQLQAAEEHLRKP